MESKVLKKILVMAIIFVTIFSNCGFTLQALATSDGLSIFGLSIFGNNELDYSAYFLDENGKEVKRMTADVNNEMTLVLELEPKKNGYLKGGTIKAVAEEGELNFEFKEILNLSTEEQEVEESLEQTVQLEQTLLKSEQIINTKLPEIELNSVEEEIVSNEVESENTIEKDTAIESDASENTVIPENANTIAQESVEQVESEDQTEALIDEEIVYQEEIEEKEQEEINLVSLSTAKINNVSEIIIENIIEPTKIYVKLKYVGGEKFEMSDLYQDIKLELVGKFINEDLEETDVVLQDKVNTEWIYTKDISVSSEITKVSPFEVEGTKGTLVESTITVNRECKEENYLPLKETVIELNAPQINGKLPIALDVSANKLKATRGEEISEVAFSNENWNYNQENNIITIKVENLEGILTSGEDIYKIIYRYDEYVASEEITVEMKGTVTVEEFSGKENNIITKEFLDKKTSIVNIGELITYSIGTTDETINKGKINANYNSVEAVYETEFNSTVSINILTNDVLKEFTIKDTKEFYIDKSNLEFETQDVKYKSIKFKYEEINEILNQGGIIEIKANTGELLYTLNSDLVKSQENCEINLHGDVRGVQISVKEIRLNGTITIDFVKAIGKCSYDKSAFNNFEKIESRIKAEVKYGVSDEIIELSELKTEKYFEKSYTRAELSMNKDELSTILDNEDVEIKIELNNHEETSDLYINPEFEIVFPSYVTGVEVQAINLLYEEGLTVKNITLFKDDNNIQRMRVQLEGVQRNFSTSEVTNGTNIIINSKIMVDNYTPRKDDQLKMYYFNLGVTNYQAQTDWKISSEIPDGILKTTNGFDVEVFSFQAPSGFITANGIENYDGLGSKIETIKQGEVTAKTEMGDASKVVTMNLAALNNTGNKCTDTVMLGRIPSIDATDVITGQKLGTNKDTQLVSEIIQADSNPIGCNIYYSYKADATQNLSDINNGWEKIPEDMSQVKSYLIIPTSEVKEGTVFKFSYNFQVPANLPYEVAMYGSFGAYYNNHSEVAVVYESTKADLVGLVTDSGPKVEAVLSVDIGDGAEVLEGRILKYTVTARNTGTMPAQGITINVKRPDYTMFTKYKVTGDIGEGDFAGYYDSNDTEQSFTIDSLQPGEVKEVSFMLKVGTPLTKVTFGEEETEVEDITEEYAISVQADIKVENLSINSTTNTITNKVTKAKIVSTVFADYLTEVLVGYEFPYIYNIKNISGEDMENLQVVCKLPKELKYEKCELTFINNIKYEESFDEETNTLIINIDNLKFQQSVGIYVHTSAMNASLEKVSPELTYKFADGTTELGPNLPTEIKGAIIKAELIEQPQSSTVLERDKVTYKLKVSNTGMYEATKVKVKVNVSENIENPNVYYEGNKGGLVTEGVQDGIANLLIINLGPGKSVDIVLEGDAKELDGVTNNKIKNTFVVSYNNIESGNFETNEIIIKENPELEDKKEEENEELPLPDDSEVDTDSDDLNDNNNITNNDTNRDNENVDNSGNEEDEVQEETNDNSNEDNSNIPEPPKVTYAISGFAWLDENKNGQKDVEEQDLSSVEVQLLKGSNVIKVTQTSINGKYTFGDIENGVYSIHFKYDGDKYITTTYSKPGVDNSINSDAVQMSNGYAVSNNLIIENANIENLNIGLQYKDTLDFTMEKLISSAKVITKKGEKVHTFEDLNLAKLEIAAKELKNATVELTYKINITNNGNAEGQVTQIVDYLPKDTTLNVELNKGWYIGKDGNAYNETLKDVSIMPGETKTFNITITRAMTEENTGVVENKVAIMSTYNNFTITEKVDNNAATQETIISIKTGYTTQFTFVIVFIIAISIISNLILARKIKIDLKNFKISRIYK